MIEFICVWAASGLVIRAAFDYLLSFEPIWFTYGLAVFLGPFITLPILQIDMPSYFRLKDYELKISEEFKRRSDGQHEAR